MVSQEFKQNVGTGDLDTIRSALIDYLIIDRSFKSFDEALEYAQNTLAIIESFNNEPPFSEEPWDNSYLNQQKVALMMNFSDERINHIKQVISKVLPAKKIERQPVAHKTATPGSERTGSRTGRTRISETPIQRQEMLKASTRNHNVIQTEKTVLTPHNLNHLTNNSEKTGSKVVRETASPTQRTEKKGKSDSSNLGTALIIGGAAIAVVGIAMVEPIVIGTGVVIAGAGVGVKAKNGR